MSDIVLINKAKVNLDLDSLNKINDLFLPKSGRILFILNDGPISGSELGVTYPKNTYLTYTDDITFIDYREAAWDCGIVLSKKACGFYEQYPAFFIYLLGHEFGHANICLTDEALHIHSCLIYNFIKDASNGKISKYYELPDEILMDRFGIYIVERIFSRKQLNKEIQEIINKNIFMEPERNSGLIELEGTNDFTNLRKQLVEIRAWGQVYV